MRREGRNNEGRGRKSKKSKEEEERMKEQGGKAKKNAVRGSKSNEK